MKRLGFIQRGRSMEKTKTNKNQATQRRHANLPARFAFRQQKKQQTNTKKGPKPQPKSPHQDHQDCLRHDRGKPNVSPKYAQKKELASLWPEKGVKSCATVKSSNKIAAVHYGSHLRVLSGVLCLSSNRLVSFGSSCSCQKAWVYSP